MISPQILQNLKQAKVMVIGDMIADQFVSRIPTRISREAPVLILEHEETKILAGGAANTIANLVDMGVKAYAVGVVGNDATGKGLRSLLEDKGVCTEGLIVHPERPTITKTRVWAGEPGSIKQQVVRIDQGIKTEIEPGIAEQLLVYVRETIGEIDAVLFSDYGYGLFPATLAKALVDEANRRGIVSAADSRYDLPRFSGATVATPNKPESEALTGRRLVTDRDAEMIAQSLQRQLQLQAAVVTRGEDGMTIAQSDDLVYHIPAFNRSEVYDVTGAGDTVIAGLTAGLAAGASIREAALLANIAASIVIRRIGTVTVKFDELQRAVEEYNRSQSKDPVITS